MDSCGCLSPLLCPWVQVCSFTCPERIQFSHPSPPTHFIRYPYGGAQKQLRAVVLPQLSSRSVAAWIRLMPTPCGFDNRLHIWILNLPAEFLLGLR